MKFTIIHTDESKDEVYIQYTHEGVKYRRRMSNVLLDSLLELSQKEKRAQGQYTFKLSSRYDFKTYIVKGLPKAGFNVRNSGVAVQV